MRRALARWAGASPAAALVFAVAVALLAVALFFGGGSKLGPLVWIGSAALVAAGLGVAAAFWGLLPLPGLGREGVAFVVLAAALVGWIGVSIVWSVAPDRSWDAFNRGLVYLSFAAVGLLLAAVDEHAVRRMAWACAALFTAVAVWALAGKVFPWLYEDYGRAARLRSPVGYWNALALVMAFGLPLALWVASRRSHALWARVAGVVSAYVLGVALLLTYSRGGIAVALFALVAWFFLTGDRLESAAALVVAAVPVGAVALVGFLLPGVADDGEPRSVRVHDGAWFGLALVLGGLVVAGVAVLALRYERPLPAARRRLLLRVAAVAGVVALLAGGLALAVRGRGDDVVGPGPSRIGAAGSNNRLDWWGEAVDAWRDAPVVGTGAASFELLHRRLRDSAGINVTEPHNLALQFLAETGVVGFLLAAGMAAAALWGAWLALRRLEGEERAATAALGLVLPTYLLHALADYDWDFVAVSGPFFLVAGLLVAAGQRPRAFTRHRLWALGAVVVTWAALFSLLAPRLADYKVDQAYAKLDEPSEAASDARAAHALNPLSIEPLHVWAAAEEARGRPGRALELYVQAVDLQPLNPDAWFELGRFELEVLRDRERARRDLARALELDPYFAEAATALNSARAGA
ncbi:MAG TPA: O-antigen ligase family protein [Gaiellaceae bacterium]|nr:O-antigen ligase family protein [Gaiellaceae bacterium]